MLNLSTEEKIKILRIALESADLYNDRVYKLQEYCQLLLKEIRRGEVECQDMWTTSRDLENLIEGFKISANKYENYQSIMSQISNNTWT